VGSVSTPGFPIRVCGVVLIFTLALAVDEFPAVSATVTVTVYVPGRVWRGWR
jgi:hypothetical protein